MKYIKRFWFTISSKYFITRCIVKKYNEEERALHHGIAGEASEHRYCYIGDDGINVWVHTPVDAHLFSFFQGMIYVLILRRANRDTDYEFMMESYADVQFTEQIRNGIII